MSQHYTKPYVIGYDLGNRTVASTVINEDYNVVKQNGHRMARVNIFSEGESKQERRAYRSARRGVNRKQWLKKQLYRYFRSHQINGNIDAVQRRFRTSWISKRDTSRLSQKSVKQLYLLRSDLYPTIWHAADALIKNDATRLPDDVAGRIQLIYEVLHNLLGRRGHFLMPNLKVDGFVQQSFDYADLLAKLQQSAASTLNLTLGSDLTKFKSAMTMRTGIMKRRPVLLAAIDNDSLSKSDQNRIKLLAILCLGGNLSKKQLTTLFVLSREPESELKLSSSNVDDQLDVLSRDLSDADMALVNIANQIYYQSQLSFLQKPGKSFVEVQLDNYAQFGKDLVLMKRSILPALASAKQRDSFSQMMTQYLNSEGQVRAKNRRQLLKNGKAEKITQTITQQAFINQCLNNLKKAKYTNGRELVDIVGADTVERIHHGDFLVKTRSVQNARIPQQAIQATIRQIIDAQKHESGLEWLGAREHPDKWFSDEKYDLERFFDFRIPYFVGPLVHDTNQSEFSWLVRREPGTLTVFNFTQKVDLIASAQRFIQRLQAKDTYLLDEPVMPASTMTYQRYEVLDELNRLSLKTLSGYRKLTTEQKQSLYELFKQSKTVSLIMAFRKLQTEFNVMPKVNASTDAWRYLKGLSKEAASLDGNKAKFDNSLSTYHKWHDSYSLSDAEIDTHYDDLETIAEILTVFDQDSKLIKQTQLKQFVWLTPDQIKRLSRDHLDGWGRLSKKLLTGIRDENDMSVLDWLWDTQKTFNQVIVRPKFKVQIDGHRTRLLNHQSTRRGAIDALLDRSYASPAVRKVIHRFAGSLNGVMKQMKYPPKLIVIESGRADGRGQSNTTPVMDQIGKLVDKLDVSVQQEWHNVENAGRKSLRLAERLYFLQNGRDIYTGKRIDFNNLSNSENIDHVIPQRLYKDNSLNNKVLTDKVYNNIKSGNQCATQVVTAQGRALWRKLLRDGLMTKQKYEDLNTDWTNPVSVKQGQHMLRRSLVETHQVNRLAAQVATMMTQDYGTKILTMRSAVTGLLRSESQFDQTKNRIANDLHHGVDAYLIAYAGQYLWTKYDWLHSVLDYNDYSKLGKVNFKISQVGFGDLFKKNGSDSDLIVNKRTGEILGTRGKLLTKLNTFDSKWITVAYETGLPAVSAGGTIANATIYPAQKLKKNKNYLPVQGKLPDVYGYRQSVTNRQMVLVRSLKGKNKGHYRFVTIPRNWEDRKIEYVKNNVKNCEIVEDDLTVFDQFEVPGTGLQFAGNGTYFSLRTQMRYSNKLLRQINNKVDFSVDELRDVIKHIIQQVRKQYGYMIRHDMCAGFKQIGRMNVDQELSKEIDKKHLQEIIDDLLTGFNCSSGYVSFSIGDVKFSRLGSWRVNYWPCAEMLK